MPSLGRGRSSLGTSRLRSLRVCRHTRVQLHFRSQLLPQISWLNQARRTTGLFLADWRSRPASNTPKLAYVGCWRRYAKALQHTRRQSRSRTSENPSPGGHSSPGQPKGMDRVALVLKPAIPRKPKPYAASSCYDAACRSCINLHLCLQPWGPSVYSVAVTSRALGANA